MAAPFPPPPQYPTGGPQPKKSNKTLWIILGVIGAFVVVCCIGGIVLAALSSDDTNNDAGSAPATAPATDVVDPSGSAPADEPSATPRAVGINTPVRDGKFEFVVKSVKCGETKIGSEYLNQTAQGQYCLVAMSVKNIGDEAQTFDSSPQKAYNASGQQYDADGTAAIYVNDNSQTFLENINPGNSVTGTIVFDIPKNQKLTKLELHDSMFSGGVAVTL